MKLPELPDPEALKSVCGPYELAQIHCLRSIAVNLEVIGSALMLLGSDGNDEVEVAMALCMKAHSVRDME